jgi:ectoine hydroxylase-related dioxygenase (phytanoyl-CoA dioxygenase family)
MNKSQIKDIYENEGCVVIPEFFLENELKDIYPIILKVHQRWLEINKKEYLKYKMIYSNNLTIKDHFDSENSFDRINLFNFITSDKINSLVRTLIGNEAFFLGSQVFFNPKDHTKEGYWHRDTQYTGMAVEEQKKAILNEPVLHFHIPFIDDHHFELVPGSHKRWDSKEEFEV